MKRKKKFPKMKRALPLALVVVMMMTMFVVSASALSFEESDFCDCILNKTIEVESYDLVESEDVIEAFVTCPDCNTRYRFTVWIGIERAGNQWTAYFQDSYNLEDVLGVQLHYYKDGVDLEDGTEIGVESVEIVENESVNNGSMVGEMTDTITTSFGGMLKGVGASIVNFFDKTVIAENGGLTTLATWTLAFLGIGFGFMVVKFITNKVRKK